MDSSRTRLLTLSSPGDTASVKVAICAEARVFPVTFERHQETTPQDNHRHIAANFDHHEGDVYTMAGKSDDDEPCFLATSALLAAAQPVKLESRRQGECDPATRTRIADARSRAVPACWELAAGDARSIMLVQFEPRGDSVLASATLAIGTRLVFLDLPAKFGDVDAWRLDDGGEVSPAYYRILFLLEGPSSYFLGIDWAGAEGGSLTLAAAGASGDFTEVIKDHRSWSP